MLSSAAPGRAASNERADSNRNVENVVKAPMNPVRITNFQVTENSARWAAIAHVNPNAKQPVKFDDERAPGERVRPGA